jgi:hypothetical protein
MQDKGKKSNWNVTTQSVYIFGREERLQSAYEIVLSTERIKLEKKDDIKFKTSKNRVVCQSVE